MSKIGIAQIRLQIATASLDRQILLLEAAERAGDTVGARRAERRANQAAGLVAHCRKELAALEAAAAAPPADTLPLTIEADQ